VKKLEFTPSDLKGCHGCLEQAQAKFDDWFQQNIEAAPVVYGKADELRQHRFKTQSMWSDVNLLASKFTHMARLVGIETISMEECKHETFVLTSKVSVTYNSGEQTNISSIRCLDCHKDLKPIGGWESV